MPHEPPHDAGRAHGLGWPVAPAALPFLYAWIAWSWWVETRTQIETLPDAAPAVGAGAMAAGAVAARIPSVLSEAAVYLLLWRARGHRLPFWRFVCWVATLSTIDLLGFSIRRAAQDAPEALRMVGAALAGPALLEPSATIVSGSAAAFEGLGLLTLVRVGMTAWAQARGIARPLGGPLLVTGALWLLSRLVAWWSVDLLRGLSPIP